MILESLIQQTGVEDSMLTENFLDPAEERVELYGRLTDSELILLAQSSSGLLTKAKVQEVEKITQYSFVFSQKNKIQSLRQTLWVLDEMNGNEKVIQDICQILQTLYSEKQAKISK